MEKVRSPEQCKALIAEAKKRFAKVDSNCLLMTGSMARLIETERLSVESYSGGLCFFADEGWFFDLYCVWDTAAPLPDLRRELPVLISEANGRGRLEGKLLAAGFSRMKVSRFYALDLTAQTALAARYKECLARIEAGGFRILPCTEPTLAEQVAALWREELEIGDVPEEHLHFLERDGDTAVCAVDRDGRVAGAYWWSHTGNSAEGRHVVTRPDCFRQGIGSALLLCCMNELSQGGAERLTSWISDSNSRSIALHERAGFRASSRTVTQYILQGDE